MKLHVLKCLFIASFLIFACGAGSATSSITPTESSIQTSVPETETTVASNIEAENVVTFDEMGIVIGFNYPENFNQGTNTNIVNAREPNAPFELAYPQHARILFTAYAVADEYDMTSEGIRVFRVEEINALEAGVIENLAAVLEGQEDHRTDFPRLAGAGSTIDDQFAIVSFQNGTGFRFLNSKSFDASSLRSTHTTFLYQGITTDGKYFVSLVFGINAPFLADLVGVPLTTQEEFENYFQTMRERVSNASPNDFIPSLEMLDKLISSIVVIKK